MKINNEIENTLPSPKDFFISIPIYKEFSLSSCNPTEYEHIQFFKETIDSYCHKCGVHSIFSVKESQLLRRTLNQHVFLVNFGCTRNTKHDLLYIFRISDNKIQKIGQFPSIADLNIKDVKKYSKALNEDKFKELGTAIKLSAHGIGIGSFVYLRRVFESLIEDAQDKAIKNNTWGEKDFQKVRMNEKIKMLEKYLPKFLIENYKLYGILSKGIHELSENECLEYFPIVKVGIEIILDEKLEEIEKSKKISETHKLISELKINKKQ